MGIVLMFIGFTGAAFNKKSVDEMKPGESITIRSYRLTVKNIHEGENDNYMWQKASLDVWKNGDKLDPMEPESRLRNRVLAPAVHRRAG